MSEAPPPTEYDYSGLPATRASSEGRVSSGSGRVLALALLPLAGVIALLLGGAMTAFADHDIASTAGGPTAASDPECILTGTCPQATTEVASSLVYLARDLGLGILVTGAAMIALGIAMIVWNLIRRPTGAPDRERPSDPT